MQYTANYQFRKPVRGVDEALIDDLNYNADKYDALINASQNSICAPYDENETYNTGDCAMHDGLLYECQNDGVTGAWDVNDWGRTTAAEHGTGGSDVEANPQGTPTDDLEKIGINGTIYNIAGSGGGGGNVYGAFVDTNRIIQASTNLTGDDTYTAVEDCAIFVQANGNTNNSVRVLIDNAQVGGSWSPNIYGFVDTFYVKRGQTIRILATLTSDYGAYTVYGLTFGTQNIFTPQIYSTEERCVGVWIDNKPLYCKTWDLQTTVTLPSAGYTLPNDIQTDLQDAEIIVGGFAIRSTSNSATIPLTVYNANGVKNCLYVDSWGDVSKFTFYYTKTTDTAGSGSYNTLGVPARHYDTTEKVVGTVEMDNGIIKPLYEKSWWLTIPSQSGGYTFPNTAMADLDQVISNEYSFGGRGMRSYTYWYSGASVVFDEHTPSGISFYFGSSDYSGRKIFYTARYTKTTD